MRATPAADIDAYLAPLPERQRAGLEALRQTIAAAIPGAVEAISYGMPAFRLDGRVVCYFAAAKGHLSFYPGAALGDFAERLAGYSLSKGTVRFQPDRPIPPDVLADLLAACAARAGARGRRGG